MKPLKDFVIYWLIWAGGFLKPLGRASTTCKKACLKDEMKVNAGTPRLFEKTDRIQILLLYRIFLQFMEGHGKLRRSAETPKQFGETLSAEHGEMQGEISSITQLFQEARYSNHNIHKEKTSRMKQAFHLFREYVRKLNSK